MMAVILLEDQIIRGSTSLAMKAHDVSEAMVIAACNSHARAEA